MTATANDHDTNNSESHTYAEIDKPTQPIPKPRNSNISSLSEGSDNSSDPLVESDNRENGGISNDGFSLNSNSLGDSDLGDDENKIYNIMPNGDEIIKEIENKIKAQTGNSSPPLPKRNSSLTQSSLGRNNGDSNDSLLSDDTLFKEKGQDEVTEKSSIVSNETTPLIGPSKKTNRFLPRVWYTIQQRSFVIFSAATLALCASAALVYFQNKAKFIAFFTSIPNHISIPVIALAALLTIGVMISTIKQFRGTQEHQIKENEKDAIFEEIIKHQPKGKVIRSIEQTYSNGTSSKVVFNVWEFTKRCANIDEKVINRFSKIGSIVKDRPLFTALLTSFVVANVAFPLGLFATSGLDGVKTFYSILPVTDIGLISLVVASALVLSIVCLGVHYYGKTSCTNLVFHAEKSDFNSHGGIEEINQGIVNATKEESTEALKQVHEKEAKIGSFLLEKVVVHSHNSPTTIYGITPPSL